jgi:hypothetical protein
MPKLEGYYIGRPVEGLTKQWAVWAWHDSNCGSPIIYLQKPKHISASKWVIICKSVSINLPVGFEF